MNAKTESKEVQAVAVLADEVKAARVTTLDTIAMSVIQLEQLWALFMAIEKASDDQPYLQELAGLGNYLCTDWSEIAGSRKESLQEKWQMT